MQRRFDAEEWERRGERLIQTHEVTVVNALAYAEALRLRLVQTMGQRARSERLVHTCVGVQHTAKTGVRHTSSRGTSWGCEQAAGPSVLTTH